MRIKRKNVLYMMRAAANMTQQQAADSAGLSLSTVANAENGHCTDKTWRALYDVYRLAGLSLQLIDDKRAAIVFDPDQELLNDARALVAVQLTGINFQSIDQAKRASERDKKRGSYPAKL